MKFVVDTNVVINALVKKSKSRKLILEQAYDFVSPDFLRTGIELQRKYILEKSGLEPDELRFLVDLLLENIEVYPIERYQRQLPDARETLDSDDDENIPFVALAYAEGCSILSEDESFPKKGSLNVCSLDDLN